MNFSFCIAKKIWKLLNLDKGYIVCYSHLFNFSCGYPLATHTRPGYTDLPKRGVLPAMRMCGRCGFCFGFGCTYASPKIYIYGRNTSTHTRTHTHIEWRPTLWHIKQIIIYLYFVEFDNNTSILNMFSNMARRGATKRNTNSNRHT